MPFGRSVVVLAVAAAAALCARPAAAKPTALAPLPWIETTLAEIAAHRVTPPRAARALAIVSVAMSEAARARRPASDAAVAGAATRALTYLFPEDATRFRGQAARARVHAAGQFALGLRIGGRIVRRARSDGSNVVWGGRRPLGDGFWAPTPPAFLETPLEPLAGTWRPWNLASGSQFRPPRPPAFGSERYAAETREVYSVSHRLTERQKQTAEFWADGPGTVTPPGHWNRIALDLVRDARASTTTAARIFATLNTAQADAFIACWDAKYTYWSERPVTAIRRTIDPTWSPYITTPPFPGYVSGHATTSAAAATILGSFFRARAPQLRAWADEAAMSRLYAGIHYRTDNDRGAQLGRKVARVALAARR